MYIIKNYNYVFKSVQSLSKNTSLIVVTKNQDVDSINLLVKANHINFGENRVQEASLKWKNLISTNTQLKLHLIGKLVTSKSLDIVLPKET
jgi:uncharacterized pyridoxal phosphate-containing UPF0001 family protein